MTALEVFSEHAPDATGLLVDQLTSPDLVVGRVSAKVGPDGTRSISAWFLRKRAIQGFMAASALASLVMVGSTFLGSADADGPPPVDCARYVSWIQDQVTRGLDADGVSVMAESAFGRRYQNRCGDPAAIAQEYGELRFRQVFGR